MSLEFRMPINFQGESSPLTVAEVVRLWEETRTRRDFPDQEVNIKFVSADEVRTLNERYRGKDALTNVLTFSYEGEHDIALCLEVAAEEAQARGVALRSYVALLLVHAFLHATGMDHERSQTEARSTEQAERDILQAAGFSAASFAH